MTTIKKKNPLFRRLLWIFSLSAFCGTAATSFGAVTLPDGTIPSNVGVQLKDPDMNAAALDKVKAAGFTWVRRGFIWEGVEKEKGVYDFAKYDAFVALCKERNLGIIAPMAFGNKLYGHPQKEPARSAYAAYAAALAEHFKDENIMFEIWNEPNTMTFWNRGRDKDEKKVSGNSPLYAEEYTNLVKATVPAMKKANPNGLILAGSVSNMWTESYKWMGFCFNKEGMLNEKWDVWTVHPYGLKSPEDYIEAYAITRKLMTDAGGKVDRPWLNTERGFPIGKAEGYAGGDAAKAFEYQAWHMVRQYMIDLLEGLPITIWYEWSGNEGFALVKTGTGEESLALKATKIMVAELNGYKLEKRVETKEPRDFVLRFANKSGGVKLVAWTSPPPMQSPDKIVDHAITIPVETSGSLELTQLQGEKSKIEVKGGSVEITLTGSPQYITVK